MSSSLANNTSPEFAAKATSIRNQVEPIYRKNFKNFIRMIIHSFAINETFVPALANNTSPEFVAKATSIRNQVEPIYRKNFKNFIRMIIHSFANGSIVTNSSLQFGSNETIPNNSTVQEILVNETKSNSSLNIIPSSINVTQDPVTNNATTNTTPSTSTNSSTTNTSTPSTINETFDSALASNSSPQFGAKAANIRSQVEPLYKKTFKNFILMQILRFKNGSIITESKLYMDPSGSNVTATQVKDVLLNGISNGNLTFQIDRGSINVTEIGNSTPPVIASSVSMICMSLLSLLLSLALHF
ncbi:hypothetical protein KOW79_022764 [Hemibagrus wyckioides]|uniref:SEA domain-containing protein n=1 Tax=Hemibagrus wyckioides TaxID=337641 RepID=A0A9D3SBV0_9TELE|nr:hypothetical protein KOW79_022764 [Hemibagrus wyckioides]